MPKFIKTKYKFIQIIVVILITSLMLHIYLVNNQHTTLKYQNNPDIQHFQVEAEPITKKHNDLSFIIATRNDNYANNPILRLRYTLQNLLLFQWKNLYNISAEIIIIEWNPVETNPHIWEYNEIAQLLNHKSNNNNINNVQIRFYSIDPFYNDRINCHPNVYCPFFEYQAKNVGIRRSTGTWKVIMNIDDLWGINLFRFVGNSIQQNTLDKNGIYQALYNDIDILQNETIRKNLTDMKLVNIGEIMGHSFENNLTKCVSILEGYKKVQDHAGDFILIHNDTLYDFYGGAFVETCVNTHLDSEFIVRYIYLNKLIPYVIDYHCSYYHIKHEPQRRYRNARPEFIQVKNYTKEQMKKIHISCLQTGSDPDNYKIVNYIWHRHRFPNSTELGINYTNIYDTQHHNWGIKNVNFDFIMF
eukprot:116145_1